MSYDVHPLTAARFADLEDLFGDRGAVGGCWCMWFRQTSREFEEKSYEPNREEMRVLSRRRRHAPGLLAYDAGRPVGWCSIGPREEFGRIERSPRLARVDDTPVWSLVCFYIRAGRRRSGVGSALLRAAVDYAASKGARCVETYPVEPHVVARSAGEAYTGTIGMFEEAGFAEVANPPGQRRIMRLACG